MPFAKNDARETNRLYALEGGVHLYSSLPMALTPGDLYHAKANPKLRQALINCNIYIIANRRRIYIDPDNFSLEGSFLHGYFVVQRVNGFEKIPFKWHVLESVNANADLDVAVALSGTHVCVIIEGQKSLVASHIVIASAESELTVHDRDLEVLYVGQGIGKSNKRNAIDRLLNHSTLQRILAENSTYYPEAEIQLLLYRFEHGQTFMSTGGDLSAEPMASVDEERAHMMRMNTVHLTRHEKVALAEAALIRHFQPWFNIQLKKSDFAARKKIAVLERLLKKDMTGLIVELCTSNLNSRLMTANAAPPNLSELFAPEALNGGRLTSEEDKLEWSAELHAMAHSHYAKFALTTPEERDTFMHGTIWNGEEQRMNFMGG